MIKVNISTYVSQKWLVHSDIIEHKVKSVLFFSSAGQARSTKLFLAKTNSHADGTHDQNTIQYFRGVHQIIMLYPRVYGIQAFF